MRCVKHQKKKIWHFPQYNFINGAVWSEMLKIFSIIQWHFLQYYYYELSLSLSLSLPQPCRCLSLTLISPCHTANLTQSLRSLSIGVFRLWLQLLRWLQWCFFGLLLQVFFWWLQVDFYGLCWRNYKTHMVDK